jgi:quercetin dioxygenase-like cupin family protein
MIALTPKHTFNYEGVTHHIYHANKGEMLPKHSHSFSHATVCHSGKCLIKVSNYEKVLDKNSRPVNLIANEWHEIEALEDGTVFVNIFAEGKY